MYPIIKTCDSHICLHVYQSGAYFAISDVAVVTASVSGDEG